MLSYNTENQTAFFLMLLFWAIIAKWANSFLPLLTVSFFYVALLTRVLSLFGQLAFSMALDVSILLLFSGLMVFKF